MNEEREKIFVKYCEHLSNSGISYDIRGKYIDTVLFFLNKASEVGKRGYLSFSKQYAEYLVQYPYAKPALLHFLASRGIGYRSSEQDGVKTRKTTVQTLEKLEKRQVETVNSFIQWLQNEKDYSQSTLRNYAETARLFFSYFEEFNQEHAIRFIAQLESNGLKPATITIRISGLTKLGEYLKKPIKLRRPKRQRSLDTENVPTEKEYQKLLELLDNKNPHFAFIVRLMATTGCRVSELKQLKYEDVFGGSVILKCKGNKYRRLLFTKRVQEDAKGFLKKGITGIVCTNKYGNLFSESGLRQKLQHYGLMVDIDKKKMHPHAFRHFFAKMYLQKTKDVVGLAEMLGHDSVDTTRLYLQKSYAEQKREYNRVVSW